MTDQHPPGPEHRPATHDTARLPSQGTTAPADPGGSSSRPPRRGLVAGVLVGALLLGGAGGVGGAAAYQALAGADAADRSSETDGGTGTGEGSQDTGGSDSGGGSGGDGQQGAADDSVQAVAETVLPSVVMIEVQSGDQGPQSGSGAGSGVIISEDGQILTNAHVASMGADGGQIRVSFNDGTTTTAEVVGTDPLTDTAVIEAQEVSGLQPAQVGSSADLQVGQPVVAVGSPFGLDATVTSGIVSAVNRPVAVAQNESGQSTAYPAVQTDAAINPGNSGGPLVDMDGNVVGINASIQTSSPQSPFGGGTGGSIGLGFAIPIDAVMPIVEQITDGEEPTHARLGVTIQDASNEQGIRGAQVVEVADDTAAAEAGLQSDDVIVELDEHRITGADSLVALARAYRPGDEVTITFRRDGEQQQVEMELGSDAQTS